MQPLRVHAAPYWHAGSCCARLLGMRAQRGDARAESTRAVARERSLSSSSFGFG